MPLACLQLLTPKDGLQAEQLVHWTLKLCWLPTLLRSAPKA